MSARATAAGAPAAPGLERVEPQLRELMALAAAAANLPPWARSLRTQRSGQFLSRVRGRGMEYDESRPYQPGDDIRQLDWRVTARTGKPHTKLFREERERPVYLCVDYGRSMFFATRGVFKAVQAARLAALLAWHGQRHGDRVGGLVFSAREHHELPPRRGPAAVMRWLKLLADEAPRCRLDTTAIPAEAVFQDGLTRLARVARPGSLVFVISDFAGLGEDGQGTLARIAAHADVALLAVYDPLEAAFPDLGQSLALTDDRETLRLAAVSADQRARYAADFEQRLAGVRGLCHEQRMLFASVDTGGDPVAALARMLSR